MTTSEEFLEHYGVPGMKWGKRKSQPRLGPSKDAKRIASIDRKIKAGGTKALTTKELQEFNSRMDLETKYNKMNPTKVKKGKAKVAAVLAAGATINSVLAFANSPAGKAVKNATEVKTDWTNLKL